MAYTFDKANANAPSTRNDAVFRDVRQPRHLSRRLVSPARRRRQPPWLMGTAKMPDVVNGYKWELYNLAEDLLAGQRPRGQDARQAAARCRSCSWSRRRSTRCSRWTTRSSRALVAPRPSATAGRNVFTYSGEMSGIPDERRAEHPQQVLHHHRRGRGPAGRRRRHARDDGRPLRRLRPLPAQGQAGVHLQLPRPGAVPLGRPGRARARQAHHRVRLQVRRPRLRQGRHRRAEGGRQGSRQQEDPAHHPVPHDDRRDLRRRRRHPHRRWTTRTTRCRSASPASSTS